MKNQIKFTSTAQFIGALCFFFSGLLSFSSALRYSGLENDFMADNWGTPLVFLLTLLFGLGWWLENFSESLALNTDRKMALLAFCGTIFVYALIGLVSFRFVSSDFLRYAFLASGNIFLSGFLFRFSVIRPEVLVKLQERN